MLRREGGEAALQPQPQPGMDDLEALVEQARHGGLTVEMAVQGERRALSQGIDLSAYRIIQEALTNTLKHAGRVRTRVNVCYGEHHLELEVTDDGAGPRRNGTQGGPGHGLMGMRERTALYGGELSAGRHPDGGLVVRASLQLAP